MADVKWIKITTDIFDDEKILLIESLPDAYAIITVWFKLLCLAGKQNNSGVFMMGKIAYTDKMLATIFRMKETTVTMALQTFEQFGMVEIIDGVITIPNWNKHQSLDAYEKKKAYDRQYRAVQREKQKALASASNDCQTSSRTTVVVPEEDKEEDKDKEVLSKDNTKRTRPPKTKFGEFKRVLLTSAEYENLVADYGKDQVDKAITFLDEYIEEKGYKSKSHNLAIRRWVMDAIQERTPKKRKEIVPKWMDTQPSSDRIKKSGDWLDTFLEEQEKKTDLSERAEKLKASLRG
jgi:predicted phage replisome organizer